MEVKRQWKHYTGEEEVAIQEYGLKPTALYRWEMQLSWRCGNAASESRPSRYRRTWLDSSEVSTAWFAQHLPHAPPYPSAQVAADLSLRG